MKLSSIICALPPAQNTGWGVVSRRITEELSKIALVEDIRDSYVLKQDVPMEVNAPLLQIMQGPNLMPMYCNLKSPHPVGYGVCEENILQRKYGPNARSWWAVIACASTWATEQMRIAVGPEMPVTMAIQGVDQDIFKPPENPAEHRNFTIWSAGKFELRKSQDVVIRAAAVMMDRHKDVRLMASWANPWPSSLATMGQSKLIRFNGDIYQTCLDYLDMDRVEFIHGNEPHGESVGHIGRCDVGVFVSRCEAGTNLPLMEAMSCGLPVVATTEHGHADVTRHLLGSPYAVRSTRILLQRGGPIVAQWYAPDLEATVNALESAYQGWKSRTDIYTGAARANRDAMSESQFSWQHCAQRLLEACQP
jgi:glycosyltransferase involved in cell wall biosynthesis